MRSAIRAAAFDFSFVFQQRRNQHSERIGNFKKRPNGRIPEAPLQVSNVAALHGCVLGKILLGPIL